MSRLISMEDAIRAIEEEWDGCCSEYPATQIIYDTTEAIERLPIIQPKKGKWIEDKGQQTLMQNLIERGEVWRVCSVCGAGHMIGHKYECDKAYHETHHNFCPNCGADMREVNNETN